jgi:lysozyme
MTEPDRLRMRGVVKTAEDFSAWVYPDSEGFATIGWGRLVDGRKGGGISKSEAEHLLSNDLARAERECESMPAYLELNPARQAVLIEMAFNMGADGLRGFKKMFAALVQQDYEHAADEILHSMMARQVGPTRSGRLAQQMKSGQWS